MPKLNPIGSAIPANDPTIFNLVGPLMNTYAASALVPMPDGFLAVSLKGPYVISHCHGLKEGQSNRTLRGMDSDLKL
jgi:hypothetical protein